MNEPRVYFVGGGPGDPELLTLKAYRVISDADVILYDDLVGEEILDIPDPATEFIHVGKRSSHIGRSTKQSDIHELLISRAEVGRRVVRLQGGDPGIFGRLGEEMSALARAEIPFEVIPGISSINALPAVSGIPLTHRGLASSFMVITGNQDPAKQHSALNWEAIAANILAGGTLVILMGVKRLSGNARALIRSGVPQEFPAAIIEAATTEDEQIITGNLASLPHQVETAGVRSPAIIIVGKPVTGRSDVLPALRTKPALQRNTLVRKRMRMLEEERAFG